MKKWFIVILAFVLAGCGAADEGAGGTVPPPVPEATATEAVSEADTEATSESEVASESEATSESEPATEEAMAEPEADATEEMEADATEEMEADTEMAEDAEEELDHAALLDAVLLVEGGSPGALERIRESGDTRFVSGLVDSLRYQYRLQQDIG
ncbi:MAG: hypothetical protein AAF485_32185, partial [Chloroflexota bacterium]